MDTPPVPGLDAVMEELRGEIEDLRRTSVSGIRREIASYEVVATKDLEASVRVNCQTALEVLEHLRLPSPAITQVTREQVRRRAAAGLPVEDLIRAYRINLGVVHARYVSICVDHGIHLASALEGAGLLWHLGDVFAAAVATEFREQREWAVVRRSLESRDLIRDALSRGLTSHEDKQRAVALGMDPNSPYAVVIARASRREVYDLERELARDGSSAEAKAVITQISGRIIGLMASRPKTCSDLGLVAIGNFVALPSLPESFRLAEGIWRVAGDDKVGLVDLKAASWRIALTCQPEVSRYLLDELIRPLSPETDTGRQLVDTLRVYLEEDRSVRYTATAMYLHENTVRYRLSRFEELTGRLLKDTDTLVELKWALEAVRQEGSSHQSAASLDM